MRTCEAYLNTKNGCLHYGCSCGGSFGLFNIEAVGSAYNIKHD